MTLPARPLSHKPLEEEFVSKKLLKTKKYEETRACFLIRRNPGEIKSTFLNLEELSGIFWRNYRWISLEVAEEIREEFFDENLSKLSEESVEELLLKEFLELLWKTSRNNR